MGQPRPLPDWSTRDERELERLYAGEDDIAAAAAFTELRRRHDRSLCGQAFRESAGDQDLADEALADTNLKWWQHRRKYNPAKGTWRGWAGTVLRNTIIEHLRRGGREWGSGLPEPGLSDLPEPVPRRQRPHRIPDPEGELTASALGRALSPEEAACLGERKAAVRDCLRRLKREQKPWFDVLVIYDWGEKTQEEIAELFGIVVSTVCKRLERARAAMKTCLERHHPEVIHDL